MQSGIGDEYELEKLGIKLVKSLPHVGMHMQEHVGLSVTGTSNLKCPNGAHRDEKGNPKGGINKKTSGLK